MWILYDSPGDFSEYVSSFKEAYPQYSWKSVIVESFSDRATYTNTLSAAIMSWTAPDVFVVPNGETSIFENQILAVDPTFVSPNDFRLRFKPVFGQDLIVSSPSDNTVEFLKGIPAWYEALGIFYNRKYFLRPSEITTWSNFTKEVRNIANKYSNIIPIALGNGSWVARASDIVSALFVLEGRDSLATTDNTQARQVLGMYNGFGQKNGDNRYNILSAPFETDIDIDYFVAWDVASMVWYPRDLMAIDKIWYKKNFLFATPLPRYEGKEKRTSINYSYFAINKDTPHTDLAQSFLAYVSSAEGQQLYSEKFPYYLSPEVNVAASMTEKKILPLYNIVYKNFVWEDDELVSYDVGNKNLYESSITPILDLESGFDAEFLEMSSYIVCSSTKQNTLLNLSSPCK